MSTQKWAKTFYQDLGRKYYVTPTSYLEMINSFKSLLAQRRMGVDLTARALDTQVALMRALGGGYRAELPVSVGMRCMDCGSGPQ